MKKSTIQTYINLCQNLIDATEGNDELNNIKNIIQEKKRNLESFKKGFISIETLICRNDELTRELEIERNNLYA